MEDYVSKIIMTAASKFGIYAVKPFQLLVMERILEQEGVTDGRNQVVILPTGTGKSLCFQLPATLCKNKTIIIYPLLALMTDQKNRLEKLGIDCVVLKGGQTKDQRKEAKAKLQGGAKIVITNPETLEQKNVTQLLKEFNFELFVVDEAHVIAQWGKDFRPAYSNLKAAIKEINPNQILAFTATAGKETLKEIEMSLFTAKPLVVQGDADRENIFYSAIIAPARDIAVEHILKTCKRPAIVFCNTRKDAEITAIKIKKAFNECDIRYYHAGLSKPERESIEQWFMKSNEGVLFTTCAYGMGIDKPNIRTVIHRTLPKTAEEYLQESGRAGRDGSQAYAWAVITKEDNSKLAEVFTENRCRREALLKMLGQEKHECTGCDYCAGIKTDLSEIETTIKSLIKRFPFRYNCQSTAALLCGTKILWKLEKNGNLNPYFGLLKNYPFEEVLNIIKQLYPDKKLLYPTDIKMYNQLARIDKEILNGYKKLVRFKGILKRSGRKIQHTDQKAL